MGQSRQKTSVKRRDTRIFQLKVTLKHSKPPIWRRIQVRDDITLEELHDILQIAMGWTNSHLHQFIVRGTYYGESNPEWDLDVEDERQVRLRQIARDVKDRFVYEYDFGDGWEHVVEVEQILEPEPNQRYPRCIKGLRACPPEDVGGTWGYDDFLEAIRDEEHPEHENYLAWVGGEFDPEAFDCDAVNAEFVRYLR